MLTHPGILSQRSQCLIFTTTILLLAIAKASFAFAAEENDRLPQSSGEPHVIPAIRNGTNQELPNAIASGNYKQNAIDVIQAIEKTDKIMPPTLRERLQKKVAYFTQEEDLKGCIAKLAKMSQIEMSIIVDESYDRDKKYTLREEENTVNNILNQLMILSDLHWIYNDAGDVQIYSHETAPVMMRTYPIKLLVNEKDASPLYGSEIDVVDCLFYMDVESRLWASSNFVPFTLEELLLDEDNPQLAITTNEYTHSMVTDFLNAVHKLNRRISAGTVKESIALGQDGRDTMITALSQNISLPKDDLSLAECVVLLRNSLSLPVWIDVASVPKGGLEYVTCKQPSVSARELLIKICEKNRLVYSFINNTIVITSPSSKLALINDLRLYDVRDLTGGNISVEDLVEFIVLNPFTIDICMQDRLTIQQTALDNSLFISADDKTHQQIEDHLNRLRAAPDKQSWMGLMVVLHELRKLRKLVNDQFFLDF